MDPDIDLHLVMNNYLIIEVVAFDIILYLLYINVVNCKQINLIYTITFITIYKY